jgi:hypothetical protein
MRVKWVRLLRGDGWMDGMMAGYINPKNYKTLMRSVRKRTLMVFRDNFLFLARFLSLSSAYRQLSENFYISPLCVCFCGGNSLPTFAIGIIKLNFNYFSVAFVRGFE